MKPRTPSCLLCGLLLLATLALSGCQFPSLGGKQPAKPAVAQGPCIVLALPGSGPYAPIASKIRKGATTAVQEMKGNGINARLEVINTSAADWLTRLDALPESCAVVGGPLEASVYNKAKQSGATEKRAFFTFMATLNDGDEGVRAWRFFPSPQDQIDALVNFANGTLGISTFGAFTPGDAYSQRMTSLMESSLQKRGLGLQKATYDARNPSSWTASAAQLVNPTQAEDGNTPIPHTPFEALFLPDSWRNMGMLTTALVYNGEDRLVLLGTMSWEQSLSGKSVADSERYALAVFPGAWNQFMAPRALKGAGNDFWTALGYDFARFSVNMGLSGRVPAAAVSAAASRIRMVWGMAPLSWDSKGLAHQKLYLFQPAAQGMKALDVEEFKAARTAIVQRAALRMQGLPAVDENGTPLVPGLPGATTQPGMAASHGSMTLPAGGQSAPSRPLSTTPRPSYKLRLPSSAR